MKASVHLIQSPPFWLNTPPLSLTYLKTYLEKKMVSVTVSDLNQELFQAMRLKRSQWLSLNKNFESSIFLQAERACPGVFSKLLKTLAKADMIGFSLLKRNTAFSFALARYIKQYLPEKKIIFGGPETLSLDKHNCLDSQNSWVVGEGEIPAYQALLDNAPGIYRFQEIDNLDDLDFYDFGPFRLKYYARELPLLSSRGCRGGCAFCSERLLYKKFRCHSPQYVVDQIKFLKNKHLANSFVFLDSMINHSSLWLEQFCLLLLKNKCDIKWQAQMKIQKELSSGLAGLMKKSGCYNLFIGLESASDNVLKKMNKGFDGQTACEFLKILHQAGLNFELSLIFGFPGETDKDFKETLSFIRNNKPYIKKIAQVNPFTDYLNAFKEVVYPSNEGKKRVKLFLNLIQKERIKHTKSFINNLIYSTNSSDENTPN